MRVFRWVVVAMMLTLLPSLAAAQADGRISGTVRDSSNAFVAGATVTVKNEKTGDKQASTSMNDKCASGTGATIDKCMLKVGLPSSEVVKINFDDSKLHHVAAKCGVFAETDIVNLVKSGIPAIEIMNSLADAIVMQNLSVLTRGNTLKPKVLLLGGPNTYLPFLRDCWRKRIPETWRDRGYQYPTDVPIEQLIIVPENAQYYAAYGAVMYGMYEPASVGVYKGMEALREFITLSPTRRGDHRSLVLAFFVVLPIQFWLVATAHFDLFTVFIPVYVFLAIPVVSALADDPNRFLERNAKLQWGIMVCVYGMSHVPALLVLDFPNWDNDKNAFLVFFLALVVQTSMVVQHLAARQLRRKSALLLRAPEELIESL